MADDKKCRCLRSVEHIFLIFAGKRVDLKNNYNRFLTHLRKLIKLSFT